MPDLDFLANVTLPSGILDGLTSLNDSIPTLAELRATLDEAISTPITSLRSTIASSLSNATLDIEELPVPARQSVDVCSGLDTSFIDNVGSDLGKFVKIALALVVLLMVLLFAAGAAWEHVRYRSFLQAITDARDTWIADLNHSKTSATSEGHAIDTVSTDRLLTFHSSVSHPFLTSAIARMHIHSPQWRAATAWLGSYVAHPPALAFLALGALGLLLVQVQLAVLDGPVRSLAQSQARSGAGEMSQSVTSGLNSQLRNASMEWALASNERIEALENRINDDLVSNSLS